MTISVDEREDAVFCHRVGDVAEVYDDRDPFDRDAPPAASICMIVGEDGDFWLRANSEGYLHLARVFAEMGLRRLEDGYHFHVDSAFRTSAGPPEFTFEIAEVGEALG